MGFSLKITAGADEGRDYTFERIEITVGRTMDNDVVLTDPGISRQHLSIRNKGGAYILKDLGSSNGTAINDKKVIEEVLKVGDVITVGTAKVRFEGPTEDEKAAKKPAARGGRARAGGARQSARGKARTGGRARSDSSRQRTGGASRSSSGRGRKGGRARGGRDADSSSGPVIRSAGMRVKEPDPVKESDDQAPKGPPGFKGLVVKFKGLSKRMKIVIISGLGLIFVLIIAAAFTGGTQMVRTMTAHDDDVFAPGEITGDQPTYYGRGPVNVLCNQQVVFDFKYANGRATMQYQVGSVDSKTEIDIMLNDMHVAYAPITLEALSPVQRIDLPRKHLLEHDINRLKFVNNTVKENPDAEDLWAVALLIVVEHPLPSPNKQKAEISFLKAKETFKNRVVAPGNSYSSMMQFGETRDYLELLPEDQRPDIYHEATDMMKRLDGELDKKFKNMMFQAEQHMKFRRFKKAKATYHEILLVFPNAEDPRYKAAKVVYDKFI